MRAIRGYFTGGNTVVRVGVIVLFFGVAFLVRYVAERTRVPIELRLAGIAVGAIGLLVLGWRLRAKRPGFALAIQGGAVGILYLTVFAALRLYSLLPPAAALALLVLIVVFSAAIAIFQDSLALAILGVSGGFLAPILASTGEGSHVVLFGYYAVLNLGIAAIAWFKAWRPLNLVGFAFTFVIASAWGVLSYQPELLGSTEPFLVTFFLLYVAIAVLFAFRQAPNLRNYVDGTLIFGTPIIAFALQAALLRDQRYALAFSALMVGALYLGVARTLYGRRPVELRLLIESFLALAVAFLTLAVPLALDGRWSAATWALEGAALVWVGCRTGRPLARATGALLQLAAGVILLTEFRTPDDALPLLNSNWLGGVMIAAGSLFASTCLERNRERLLGAEGFVRPVLFWWGVLWWTVAGLVEIDRLVGVEFRPAVVLLFVAGTAVLSSELHRLVRVSHARYPPLLLLPAMALLTAIGIGGVEHPFAGGGGVAWPVAFGCFYLLCRRHEDVLGPTRTGALHIAAVWLLTFILSWECVHAVGQALPDGGAWQEISWVLVPAIILLILPDAVARIEWPFGAHRNAFLAIAGGGLAVYGLVWILITSVTSRGGAPPLPYLPLLNPLDVATVFVICAGLRLWVKARTTPLATIEPRTMLFGFAGLTFIWLNAVLLRTLHQWMDVPFRLEAMARDTLVQTSLSIFWAVLALATMVVGTRRGARQAWLAGASLLGVVVIKLFIVDLSRVGTVERIVSFLGVGVLMLLIGYLSPAPPASGDASGAGQRDPA